MDQIKQRLATCFLAVFPELTPDGVEKASTDDWDSLAAINLFAIVQEEFGVSLEDADSVTLNSFENLLMYLQRRTQPS